MMRRQDIGREERHPLEQVRRILLDVAGDDVALRLQVRDRGPDEGDRVAGLGVGDALQVPDDILGGDRLAVLPPGALAHLHADLALVVGPAPFRQQAGAEAQIGILVDILIEHAFVDRHELGVDRGQAGRRVPGRQRHVIGDGQRVADRRRRRPVEQQRAEAGGRARGAGGVQELPAVENGHGLLPPEASDGRRTAIRSAPCGTPEPGLARPSEPRRRDAFRISSNHSPPTARWREP